MTQPPNRSDKLVSIVVLSYRNLEGVYETLDSIFRQTYGAIEIVVSDDGTPGFGDEEPCIREFIRSYKSPAITNVVIRGSERNEGTVKNINKGILASSGEYVKVLAAEDCFAVEDAIQTYVDFLESSDFEICFAKMKGIAKDGTVKDRLASCEDDYDLLSGMTPQQMENRLFARNCLPAPAWCAKRSLFEKHGLFPECTRLIEDYPYWLKLSHEGVRFGFIDKVLVMYRLSGVSSEGHYSESFMDDMYIIYDTFIFPNDNRFGPAQPLYNKLKRSGLDYYMSLAKQDRYSAAKKALQKLKYAPFSLYTYIQGRAND